MTQDLALIQNNPTAINALFGFEGKPKPQIPVLKVNGSDEGDGSTAPKGTFVVDDGDGILFAPEVSIRSFVKAYQYRIYDSANPANNDQSTIENNFKREFRSTSGRIACGKMQKKLYEELGEAATPQQRYLQENVKCKLIIFGLVSGKFTNLDSKEEVQVEDELFNWTVSQSGFMAMDRAITGIAKERRAVPLTPIKLSLKKEKMGSVTYFVPVPNVTTEVAVLDIKRDEEYLNRIAKFISDNNNYVTKKYNEALRLKGENNDFATVGEILDASSREIADDSLNDL